MGDSQTELLHEGGFNNGHDIYYASGFAAPDPFTFIRHEGRRIGVLSDLEIGRAAKTSRLDELISLKAVEDSLRSDAEPHPSVSSVIAAVLSEREISAVAVPRSFPFGLAEELRERGIAVSARPDPFFPEREIKSADEITAIAANQRHTEAAMARAIALIAEADIGEGGVLMSGGEPLTSERVKYEIAVILLQHELIAMDTIVAGGDQGCDPHETGSGPLYAEQTIIIDIFPVSSANQYWADITRTVYKGTAPDELRDLYAAVAQGQQIALDAITDGADALAIHQSVQKCFTDLGWPTDSKDGAPRGFMHGTGHGLGLEIHERPRISSTPATLRSGMVVTVEPGLYYPGLGGVRIEDLVVVTEDGHRNLTSAPKLFEV